MIAVLRAGQPRQLLGVGGVEAGREIQRADGRAVAELQRHRDDAEDGAAHPRDAVEAAVPGADDSATGRPRGKRSPIRPAAASVFWCMSTSTTASDSTLRGDLLELAVDRRQQLRLDRVAAGPRLGLVGVERRLERRVLGERRRLRHQLALAPGLERREHPLAGLQVRGHRLPHLIADADADDDEDDQQEQTKTVTKVTASVLTSSRGGRRASTGAVTADPRPAATGRRSWLLPRSTRTSACRSPTRSCQPIRCTGPAARSASSKLPSSAGNREVRVVHHEDRRAHVRVDVAVDLDDAGLRERLAAALAARVAAQIERRRARQREDVVEDRIVVRKVDRRSRVIASTCGTNVSCSWRSSAVAGGSAPRNATSFR